MAFTQEQARHTRFFFDIAVLGKGILSAIEVVSGSILAFLPVSSLSAAVLMIFHEELMEDPTDFLATHAVQAVGGISPFAKSFLAIYLIVRGLVKLGLVVALVKRKLWAYPASIALLAAFMAYQVYLVVTTGSAIQLALVILDIFVVWAIWREYRLIRDTKE